LQSELPGSFGERVRKEPNPCIKNMGNRSRFNEGPNSELL
jgi:hypothetical protein